ncbi:hypothetical protein EDB19DRAFT_1914319 [Suillus lakei]|nr:hypothetical protein EDB19DRAFT_1914319 [Suillus lakei]
MSDDHTLCCQLSQPNAVYTFDKGSSIRRIVIFGSLISITFSLGILFAGVGIWIASLSQDRIHGLLYSTCHVPSEIPSIALNLVVTACTECAGVMHSTSLRFALFRERRVTYNSNLRLLTGSDEKSMNSAIINAIMALLLILSYASSSFFYQKMRDYDSSTLTCGVLAIPAIVLGISMFLQTCISLFALRDTEILTWNTSPFDTIPALLSMHDRQSLEKFYPFPDSRACMCAVCTSPAARKPLDRQPSAWDTRRSVRISIYLLWGLGIACMIWGAWVSRFVPNVDHSWQFIPNPYVHTSVGGVGSSFATWFSLYAVMAVAQGGLTFGLHCAELVAGVIRDETMWRRASKGGTNSSFDSWLYVFCLDNWLYVVLLFAKPVLHWIFGLAVEIGVTAAPRRYFGGISFHFAQIFYLGFSLFVVAMVFTVAARYHPKGDLPATYGHIKTLLHLMDDRQEVKSWDHMDDGPPCHEGLSREPLLDGDGEDDGWFSRRKRTYA